jgi:hypothetical protein
MNGSVRGVCVAGLLASISTVASALNFRPLSVLLFLFLSYPAICASTALFDILLRFWTASVLPHSYLITNCIYGILCFLWFAAILSPLLFRLRLFGLSRARSQAVAFAFAALVIFACVLFAKPA